MKKEYVAFGVLGLFIFGYVLDYVAGPIQLTIKSPYAFLDPLILAQFPFTAVSIAIKTLALFATILLGLSFIERMFFTKGVVLFCIGALLELYSIQQLMSGAQIVPIQWNLTFAATGILLLLPTVGFMLVGLFHLIREKMKPKSEFVSH